MGAGKPISDAIIYGISWKFTPFKAQTITIAQGTADWREFAQARRRPNVPKTSSRPKALRKTVVLVGMMGSGKTAVGTALARLLGVPFLDSDEEIVKAAQMPVAEIFERDGEPFFRARESEVIERLLSGPPAVVSTGGGAFMSERNREMIARLGVSVWLKADLELLWNRVKHKNTRPLLRTADPKATLTNLLAQREPVYALAQVSVEAEPALPIEAMAQKVADALQAQGGLFEEE